VVPSFFFGSAFPVVSFQFSAQLPGSALCLGAASLLRKKEGQKDRAAAEHPRSCSTDFHSIRFGAPRMARVLAGFKAAGLKA
jgi:hypothetical protein